MATIVRRLGWGTAIGADVAVAAEAMEALELKAELRLLYCGG